MVVLSQYSFIFAVTAIFAFIDGWNVGANDVANSFATSVSSRSLTLKQAMCIAAVMEFSGSIAVGQQVAITIQKNVIAFSDYEAFPEVLLLGMMCSVISSSTFLTIATHYGFPVSTTHSIIGGFVGIGTATFGLKSIKWDLKEGVSQVFAAWLIAPGMAGCIGTGLFLVTKHFVLTGEDAAKRAFYSIPVYTFGTVGALTLLVAWQGLKYTSSSIVICVFAIATGVTLLQIIFILPFLWCRVMKEDWTLRWWDVFKGPLLLKRPPAPPPPPGVNRVNIRNYYRDFLTREEVECLRQSEDLLAAVLQSPDTGNVPDTLPSRNSLHTITTYMTPHKADRHPLPTTLNIIRAKTILPENTPVFKQEDDAESERRPPPGPWHSPQVLFWNFKRLLLRGVEQDVVRVQRRYKNNKLVDLRLEDIHSRAIRFDNRCEYMYSSIQILTAATASFVHGANDVANFVAPFTTAYNVWNTGRVDPEIQIPVWVLCLGGLSIVLGLSTYGYHVMRTMGNRMTLISPSRGFCMEMAAAITVLIATKYKLPVSTTQCIAGATIGVGLANRDRKAVNWRLVAWIYFGWLITVPATAVLSGLLMSLLLRAPKMPSIS